MYPGVERASGVAMKRVPIHTPSAPSASDAARPAVEEPAGRDDRNPVTDRVDHLRHERHRGDGARVATGFGALGDDDVAAGFDGGDRVADLPAHVDDEDVVVVAEPDHVARTPSPATKTCAPPPDHELDVRHHLLGSAVRRSTPNGLLVAAFTARISSTISS